MGNWLQILWSWIVEVIPCLVAVGVYFAPGFFRRWKKFAYTPLYFSVYPLSHIKRDVVDKYIGSQYYPPFLQDEDEAEKIRKKTILLIGLSSMMDTVLIPVCVAFLLSLVLSKLQFIITLVLILIIQGSRFLKSYLTVQKHMYGTVKFRGWIAVVYIFGLIVIGLAMVETWRWVGSSLEKGGYIQLFWNVADLLWTLIPMAMVAALVGTVITMVLFDKKARQDNIHENQKSKNNQNVITSHSNSKQTKRANKK